MKNRKVIFGLIILILVIGGIFVLNFKKVSYTKEFKFLPQYGDMQVEKYELAQNDQFGNAIYRLEGVEYKKFLIKYEKVLIKDGWKVAEDKKPESIEVTKGDHMARINAVNSKDFITVLVWTK